MSEMMFNLLQVTKALERADVLNEWGDEWDDYKDLRDDDDDNG